MADEPKKFSPKYEAKVKRLEAAFDAYLRELRLLRNERKDLKERFLHRVDSRKIDEILKLIKSL